MDISERNLEATIEHVLLTKLEKVPPPTPSKGLREQQSSFGDFTSGGYIRRHPDDYNRALCLDPEMVIAFVQGTQPKEWEKLKVQHADQARELFIKRLASELKKRGTLDVFRKGIKDRGVHIRLAYFRPSSGLNPEIQRLYEGNIFSVVRQLKYSLKTEHSLDLTIFLNGLPIFTAELKNPFTGQTVLNAIAQYRKDRDPAEPLFQFGRCLAHFAVDPDLVMMTTRLRGEATSFLPFNKGKFGGAGNPPVLDGFSTAYLWEQVWSRDSVLNLIQHFISEVELEDEDGRKTGEKAIIFPRYHQLESVRRLVADARQRGPGNRYLIQHSAGSGKSNSIAWLAHQLSVLHDEHDRRVFDSIIVITDRRVLDRQLQQTVRQFEQTLGVVENIDTTSKQLKQALEEGKTIIVSTLQKYPVIANQVQMLAGKRFAVIIDEAHSSQSGESTKGLKTVLSTGDLEQAEREEDTEPEDMEDIIIAQMQKRGQLPNISTFAFTATPKQKTLELFGAQYPDSHFEPFSLYSMRQAIEEGFILDVLQNYTTYHVYFRLLKTIADDPRYDRAKANYLLQQFVSLHPHAVREKVALIVEHFHDHVDQQIGGKAKAMIVTRSRLHAVKYKLMVDAYLAEKGYPYRALVAFSGTVKDAEISYTETNMNTMSEGVSISEAKTAATFKQDKYRILIVANKFQTGFDQPLLHTMYVDKKLGGVNAVQTLSRLNRTYPGKDSVLVLDFANDADTIQKAFEPYYERTILSEGTDPNLLYDIQHSLGEFHLYSPDEVEGFARVYFNPTANQAQLHAPLAPIVARYDEAPPEKQADFRSKLNDYIRLYAFLSQILTFTDPELEKLYQFARFLLRKLPVKPDELPREIQEKIDIESFQIQETHKGNIKLKRGAEPLAPMGEKGDVTSTQPTVEALSQIITELNQRFGANLGEDSRVCIEELQQRVAEHPGLAASVRTTNSRDNIRLAFNHVASDQLQDMMEERFKFYKQVTDDPQLGKALFDWMFDQYYQAARTQTQP